MMLGNATHAVMQIKWWRPGRARFQAARWLRERLKGAAVVPLESRTKDFAQTAWVPAPKLEGEWVGRSLWYGYSQGAGLVVEAVVNSSAGGDIHRAVESWILPSLGTSKREAPTQWAVFGASFESPPGFAIQSHRLHLGDLALVLESRDGRRLLLRQIYPADIALKRRTEDRWLTVSIFKEYRKYRTTRDPRAWEFESGGKRFKGMKREGRKRLPFPLGGVAPRVTVGAIVRDEVLGRLLVAEHDTPEREPDESAVKTALTRMNWALEGAAETR